MNTRNTFAAPANCRKATFQAEEMSMRKVIFPLAAAAAAAAALFTPGMVAHAAPKCDPAHPEGCATPTTEPRHAGPLPTDPNKPDFCGAGEWGELEADNKWHCYPNNSGPPGKCPPPAEWILGACVAHPPKTPPSFVGPPGGGNLGPLPPTLPPCPPAGTPWYPGWPDPCEGNITHH
jgi:hypothetical protein